MLRLRTLLLAKKTKIILILSVLLLGVIFVSAVLYNKRISASKETNSYIPTEIREFATTTYDVWNITQKAPSNPLFELIPGEYGEDYHTTLRYKDQLIQNNYHISFSYHEHMGTEAQSRVDSIVYYDLTARTGGKIAINSNDSLNEFAEVFKMKALNGILYFGHRHFTHYMRLPLDQFSKPITLIESENSYMINKKDVYVFTGFRSDCNGLYLIPGTVNFTCIPVFDGNIRYLGFDSQTRAIYASYSTKDSTLLSIFAVPFKNTKTKETLLTADALQGKVYSVALSNDPDNDLLVIKSKAINEQVESFSYDLNTKILSSGSVDEYPTFKKVDPEIAMQSLFLSLQLPPTFILEKSSKSYETYKFISKYK